MRNSIAVIGLGNILLKDEGVGVHAVEALQRRYDLPEVEVKENSVREPAYVPGHSV
jgi:hydrogenase maturation protease